MEVSLHARLGGPVSGQNTDTDTHVASLPLVPTIIIQFIYLLLFLLFILYSDILYLGIVC